MMDKKSLRRADLITAIILMVFGLSMLIETLKMPMKDTFGGVINVWYVSPALFPLFITAIITLLGFVLLLRALKDGGGKFLMERIKTPAVESGEKMLRFLAILIALITFIYLYIPRVDFFLSILIFLGFFMSVFTFDESSLFKRLTVFYTLISVFFFLLFISGLSGLLIKAFIYSVDVLVLIAFIWMMLFIRKIIRGFPDGRRNYRNILILSIVTPLLLCPLFKYGLRVPLPKEGGIIGLMNLIWYRIF